MTPRQQLNTVLDNLPPVGGAVAEGSAGGAEAVARDSLVEPIQRINDTMRPYGLEFEISEDSSRTITRIIDRENDEVIRQIPPEEVLQVAERLGEVQGRLMQTEA
jgi:flagellar protein FlaG